MHFSLSSAEPKKTESLNLENFSGFLEGNSASGASHPIIAIVTHYDNLSVIPDLPSGLNNNSSGVVVLMELIRILSKFYENYDNFIKYDLLFLFSTAGKIDFEGTQSFINALDSSLLDNIAFVLCLDSLGQEQKTNQKEKSKLYMHVSRFPKEDEDHAISFQKVSQISLYSFLTQPLRT